MFKYLSFIQVICSKLCFQVFLTNTDNLQAILWFQVAIYYDHSGENKRERKYGQIVRPWQRPEKKIWNIKVMVISLVVGTLGSIARGLIKSLEELEIRRRIETIQSAVLRSARILRRVHASFADLPSLRLQWNTRI